MRIDDALIAQVVAAFSSADRPVTLDRARIERHMRTLALDHADGRIGTDAYLERHAQLRADLETADTKPPNELTAARAVEWLRALADTWTTADVREAKAELLHAIYDRIVVVGRTIVSTRLTAAAYAHGLAIALPEVVMARPEGFEPPTV